MLLCTTVAAMHAACRDLRAAGTLGLVPTMGALHEGHLSLVASARAECDAVAASIFVNPTQFAPGEDLAAYPRTFDEDCRKLAAAGVHVLFAPSADEMYPAGNTSFVDPGAIATRLDGASRPGHFRGVATIVARLFHIAGPDRAYFGQKDAAQVAVLRHIVRDLNLPVQIVVCPIVREPDGLAMSSRNRYLSADERRRALILFRALTAAQLLIDAGETRAETLRTAMLAVFASDPSVRIDYASVVDPGTLLPVADTSRGALLAVAAWLGKTRLIDNLLVAPRPALPTGASPTEGDVSPMLPRGHTDRTALKARHKTSTHGSASLKSDISPGTHGTPILCCQAPLFRRNRPTPTTTRLYHSKIVGVGVMVRLLNWK